MVQEIEQYLWKKFNQSFEKSLPLYSQFNKIKSLLEPIFATTTTPLPSPVDQKTMREYLYYLNNALTECQMLSRKVVYTPAEILSRNNISNRLNKIREDLKTPRSNGSTTHTANANNPSSEGTEVFRWSTQHVGPLEVQGFKHEAITVQKMLIWPGSNDRFKAIGVTGISGIGKTTLCQVIFNKREVKNHFLPRIWVCMSRLPNEEQDQQKRRLTIVKRMLMGLGAEEIVESYPNDMSKLLYALHLQLRGKRYLIALDDATEEDDEWYQQLNSQLSDRKWSDSRLAYGLPKGYGGTVIVTSRNEELARKMVGEENLHHLLPLSDPDSCWEIFKATVQQDGKEVTFENEKELKEDIKKKCAGVPLAAKMMGQILYEERLEKENSNNSNNQQRVVP